VPDGWQWDSTLFKGSAPYYERGRLPYAPGFAETLATALGLDGQGRLLDVGCGPGTVTLALARFFTEVAGIDPDEDMLAEAEREARRRGVTNARWVTARAEDLPAGLGEFRVVVFAQSFHWTDRDRVAATVLEMLEPGGAFVHMSDLKNPPAEPAPLPLPAPPFAQISDLVRRYLGPVRRAGQGSTTSNDMSCLPGKWSTAPRTTSWRGCSPDPTPPLICSATGLRTSSGTCAWCYSKYPTTASLSIFQQPRS
jgi:SAM-dependent methyltransferase